MNLTFKVDKMAIIENIIIIVKTNKTKVGSISLIKWTNSQGYRVCLRCPIKLAKLKLNTNTCYLKYLANQNDLLKKNAKATISYRIPLDVLRLSKSWEILL